MVVFYNIEDKNRIFGGPYFFNSAGLYLTFWKERFHPDKEDLSIALVWIRLYSLPCELWRLEILTDIGNAIGNFVKVAEQTKRMRFVSFVRICVYLDIFKELSSSIKLSWQVEEWEQEIDYEHIPFRCRLFHEYGHLYRDYPQTQKATTQKSGEEVKDTEGFEKVGPRRRPTRKANAQKQPNNLKTKNKFEALNSINEEGEGSESPGKKQEEQPGEKEKMEPLALVNRNNEGAGMEEQENNIEEMEIGELDLDGIEKACDNLQEEYIPSEQIAPLQEALIKTKGARGLGIAPEPMKGGEAKRRGRRPNAQRIRDVGGKLMATGKYLTIAEAFKAINRASQ